MNNEADHTTLTIIFLLFLLVFTQEELLTLVHLLKIESWLMKQKS